MARKQTSQVTTGALIIVLGLIFLFDRLDITQGLDIGKLWPLLLLVIGFGQLLSTSHEPRRDESGQRVVEGVQVGFIQADGRRRSGDGIWLIFIGGLFLLHNFHVLSIRQSWPLFIVVTGLSIMFTGSRLLNGSRRSRDAQNSDAHQEER